MRAVFFDFSRNEATFDVYKLLTIGQSFGLKRRQFTTFGQVDDGLVLTSETMRYKYTNNEFRASNSSMESPYRCYNT